MQQASQLVAVTVSAVTQVLDHSKCATALLNLVVLQAGVAECTKLLLLAVEDL